MMRYLIPLLTLVTLLPSWSQETVYLTDGKFQQGKIISQTDQTLTFEFLNSGSKTQSTIPWSSIEKIEFTASKEFLKAVNDPDQVELSTLAELWNQQADYLTRPMSRTAQVGLVYADKLANSKEDLSEESAIDLYNEIAEKAWSRFHQGQAIRGKLRLLIKTGREREAIREAEALALKTENPEHLLEAKYVLAESAFAKLKEIEQENPRWHLDDEVRPERNQLYNRAIDHSLYAFLFYGTQEQAATRGLLHAAQVYEFGNDLENSENCAGDILRLYPESQLTENAKQHLTNLSKLKKK